LTARHRLLGVDDRCKDGERERWAKQLMERFHEVAIGIVTELAASWPPVGLLSLLPL
jgi:hypothetical protein